MTRTAVAMLMLATAAAVVGGIVLRSPALLEGWLTAFVLLIGFAVASLGLLMIGHVLGDRWLDPIRDELEPASTTLPVLAALSLPLAFGLAELYPWVASPDVLPLARRGWFSRDWFLLRSAAYLAVWTMLAFALVRGGRHRLASAGGLALLGATFSLAAVDWVMSREPLWWSSLFGFALAVSQLLAALAAAILVTVSRQSHPESEELESLERALLTLALLVGWVWFAHFLVVWMADLPHEARWYVRRDGGWRWLQRGVAVPALALAIVLLVPSAARRWRVVIACGLILVHHVAHMIWIIRPAADHRVFSLQEVLAGVGVAALWALWFVVGMERHARRTSRFDQGRATPSASGGAAEVEAGAPPLEGGPARSTTARSAPSVWRNAAMSCACDGVSLRLGMAVSGLSAGGSMRNGTNTRGTLGRRPARTIRCAKSVSGGPTMPRAPTTRGTT
jgi:hypothetical protein